MELVAVTLVLLCVLVGLGCWLGFQLLGQGGRLLLRFDELEERLAEWELSTSTLAQAAGPIQNGHAAPQRTGLPIGSDAPDWELPDLAGTPTSLSSFRGKRVLLVFFSPGCGFCTQIAPELAALPMDDSEHPVPVVITNGGADANLKLVQQHGLRCPVLLQEGMTIASRYEADGTPMGYLLDQQGRIASELAVGGSAVLELATQSAEDTASAVARAKETPAGASPARGNRPLSSSRIQRDGLAAGSPAPDFRVPRLDGAELALEDYRGAKVLLVFSDPHCGPCQELAPQLEQVHQQNSGLRVLMVSRGDEDENRRKAEEHGLTYPIGLQKSWEISRLYAIFATPVGYLIGADGRIATEVATGAEAIMSLVTVAETKSSSSPPQAGVASLTDPV